MNDKEDVEFWKDRAKYYEDLFIENEFSPYQIRYEHLHNGKVVAFVFARVELEDEKSKHVFSDEIGPLLDRYVEKTKQDS